MLFADGAEIPKFCKVLDDIMRVGANIRGIYACTGSAQRCVKIDRGIKAFAGGDGVAKGTALGQKNELALPYGERFVGKLVLCVALYNENEAVCQSAVCFSVWLVASFEGGYDPYVVGVVKHHFAFLSKSSF